MLNHKSSPAVALFLLTACLALAGGAAWLYTKSIRFTQTLALTGLAPKPSAMPSHPPVAEVPVTPIPLIGPITQPSAELSGLAWYDDTLILLPQYPARFGENGGVLFALTKEEIVDYLSGGEAAPLRPVEIPFVTGGVEKDIWFFEGFEAIAFRGDQVFLTIEARNLAGMRGYLVAGRIAPDLSEIRLDPGSLVQNLPQMDISNKSDEAVFVAGNAVVTLYEVNGVLNPSPHATRFGLSLQSQGMLPLPHLEYRLTDAAAPDDSGRFWVINVYYYGEKGLKPHSDPLAERYGEGETHMRAVSVERLVEFQYTPDGIAFTETPPVQLQLEFRSAPRNWEGLACLDGMGFLLVTDKFPETLLGFVPYPRMESSHETRHSP